MYMLFCQAAIAALFLPTAWAQETDEKSSGDPPAASTSAPLQNQAFTAIKFARQVRVLPDGKRKFLKNERYPVRIARDAEGRLMMQVLDSNLLARECDHLEQRTPPVCPAWSIFVIDPVAYTVTDWLAGERAAHIAVKMPLSEAALEQATHLTSELPDLPHDFDSREGHISTEELGEKTIEGVRVHGSRATLVYTVAESGQQVEHKKIHEVWIAPELKLIVRVIDGDPDGIETIRGLEKISLSPEASLFQYPSGYELQHRSKFTAKYYEWIEAWLGTWFDQ
jgi:hypothetical protein